MSIKLSSRAIYVEKLGVTYHQQGRVRTFCHQDHSNNFSHNSLEQTLSGAMLKAFYQCRERGQFIPVAFGRINGVYGGVIGMLRFYNNKFEFSYFDPTGYDKDDYDRYGKNAEIDIIFTLNRLTVNRPQAPYQRNMTMISFDLDAEFEDAFSLALSTLIYALSHHLTVEQESELGKILS